MKTRSALGDRYDLGPLLGEGGMARVYRGTDRRLDRPVAVKILAEPFDRDRVFVARFRREAQSAARLNHPNIVAVYDSGSTEGTHFLVTELVDGDTLSERLRRDGALPPQEAARIAADVAAALAAAHEAGVIHRDVKPGNVMLLPEGRVKVLDFGIAHAAGDEELTRSGLVLGSASTLSPEQATGGPVDERSDLYSLGCVLYQMLTGRPPFAADDPVATLYRHVHETPAPPSTIRAVPEPLERIALRCLEKSPEDRYASAGELERALRAAADGIEEPTARLPAMTGEEPTAPVPVALDPPTAPVPSADTDATTPVVRPVRRSPRRSWPSRRGRIVVACLAALAVLAAVLALGFEPPNLRREAREARRRANDGPSTAAEPAGTRPVTPEATGPPTVPDAYSSLVGTIVSTQSSDGIDEKALDKLREHVDRALDRYEGGDLEGAHEELGKAREELAKAVDEGSISLGAADEIEAGILDLEAAMTGAAPVAVGEDQGPGPPPHAEANGHGDEDEGD